MVHTEFIFLLSDFSRRCYDKKLFPLALAAMLSVAGLSISDAEDLVIDGLGRLPFPKDVTVTDGGGSELSRFMIEGTHRKIMGDRRVLRCGRS